MERVIFRRECDLYHNETENFLAIFPDSPARPGFLCCVSFYLDGYGGAVFESFTECGYGYYRDNTRRVRKNSADAVWCKRMIEQQYGGKYRIMEKIM